MATKTDTATATAFLRARYPGSTGITPLRQGVWSSAYAFDWNGKALVARFGTHRDDFERDRLAGTYTTRDLPIPAVLEIGDALGGSYAISERALGTYIEDLGASAVRRLLPSLLTALDAMRAVRLADAAGFGGWDGAGRAPHASWREHLLDVASDRPTRLGPSWRSTLATTSVGTAPFDEAFAAFRRYVERCPEERHLVHSDLLHFNVLVANDRVTAIFDWGSSIYGDFLFDIAWLTFWSPWYPAWSGIDFASQAKAHYRTIGLSVPDFAARLLCYELYIGLESQAWYAQTGDTANLERTAAMILERARRD